MSTHAPPPPDPFLFLGVFQMEIVRSKEFPGSLADALNSNNPDDDLIVATDLSYASLGYIVVYDVDQPFADTLSGDGLGNDFHDVVGPDQWWPWWAWLMFGLACVCCLCPLAFCIYHFRPGYSGPPSPSGAGDGGGLFGKGELTGKDGFKKGMEGDMNVKEFEKNGGYLGDGTGYNDADTGVSVSFVLVLGGEFGVVVFVVWSFISTSVARTEYLLLLLCSTVHMVLLCCDLSLLGGIGDDAEARVASFLLSSCNGGCKWTRSSWYVNGTAVNFAKCWVWVVVVVGISSVTMLFPLICC